MANVHINEEFHHIVAACAFCGRWRDSLGEYHVPPPVVEVMVEKRLIELSHTYCPECLRENCSVLGGMIAFDIAERQEQKRAAMVGSKYDQNDIVHNLLQSLSTPVANAPFRPLA